MHLIAGDWAAAPRKLVRPGSVFAVGDVHGCSAQLEALRFHLAHLIRDSRAPACIVYLGDYIDRGPDSMGVLSELMTPIGTPATDEVFLAGNHDQYLIEMIGDNDLDFSFVKVWFDNGGLSTLTELGVPVLPSDHRNPDGLRDRIRRALDPAVSRFLLNLEHYHRIGDFLFVHAGIIPGVAPEDNDLADLLLVRDEFLDAAAPWPHEFCVVHGHTPSCPRVAGHRIAVDTGAYITGALTAVHIEQDRLRFLTVSETAAVDWRDFADRRLLRV